MRALASRATDGRAPQPHPGPPSSCHPPWLDQLPAASVTRVRVHGHSGQDEMWGPPRVCSWLHVSVPRKLTPNTQVGHTADWCHGEALRGQGDLSSLSLVGRDVPV